MAIEVFNRYENKYIIDDRTYAALQKELLQYMELDGYNRNNDFYTICNIYYDTSDSALIRKSLSKPQYKEKLRLRSYGVPGQDSKVYLEIKKKFGGVVNKRRTVLALNEAYDFICTGEKPLLKDYMNRQVINEIEYLLKIYDLEPKLYLAYDRKAMFCRQNRDLRITFDTNVRTRREDLRLECGDYGEELLEAGQWLMEIKAEKSLPVWLCHLLSEHRIYKTSFSKYGSEYYKYLNSIHEKKGESNLCLNHFSVQHRLIPQYQ